MMNLIKSLLYTFETPVPQTKDEQILISFKLIQDKQFPFFLPFQIVDDLWLNIPDKWPTHSVRISPLVPSALPTVNCVHRRPYSVLTTYLYLYILNKTTSKLFPPRWEKAANSFSATKVLRSCFLLWQVFGMRRQLCFCQSKLPLAQPGLPTQLSLSTLTDNFLFSKNRKHENWFKKYINKLRKL